MSLHIRVSGSEPVVKTAFTVFMSQPYDYSRSALHGLTHFHDLLIPYLAGHLFFCPTTPRLVSSIAGLNGFSYEPDTYSVSCPVQEPPNIYTNDELFYGSFYHNLQLFGSFLTGKSFRIPSTVGEKPCRHATFSGELVSAQDSVPLFYEDFAFWGYIFKMHNTHRLVSRGIYVNSLSPLDVTAVTEDQGGTSQYNIIDLLLFLRNNEVENYVFDGPHLIRRVLHGVEFSLSYERLVFSWNSSVYDTTSTYNYFWKSEVVIPFVYPPPTTVPHSGDTIYFPVTASSILRTSDFVRTDGVSDTTTFEYQTDFSAGPIMLSNPIHTSLSEPGKMFVVKKSLESGRFLIPFKNAVDKDFFDISASALFSTVDAFKQSEGYLGTNVLQNLAKLPNISSALPKIKEAVDLLGSLARKDLSLHTLKDILDLSTQTILQHDFEWRPYHDLLFKYLPEMISTLHNLGKTSNRATGYGSFSFKMTNQLGRKEVTLLTRTKLVMDTSSSGLLSAVLGIDALGLLPKASNVWDLIPFTFVVNWFTGVGEALRRAEYSLLLATIPAYFVHTYTISSPLSSDELEILKTSSFDDQPATLRLYYRDISLYTPYPRDSKFGFGIPTGLPSIGTIGSLLYQLIFS